MSRPIAYGVDFGTTNSLLSIATKDSVDLLTVDGDSELLRSMIYLHRQGIRSVGTDAIRQFENTARVRTLCARCDLVEYHNGLAQTNCNDHRPGSGCFDSRLVGEIKRVLADHERDSTHSWARDFDYPDLAGTILRTLKRRADRALGSDVRRVVVGYPVAFHGTEGAGFAEKQRLAVARLQMAAERAGFTDVQLLQEPAAAVLIEPDEGIVLPADSGGGTFDVSVIEMTETQGRVRSLAGAAIGGEYFDGLLFQHLLFPQLGLTYGGPGRVPNRYREKFGRRGSAVRALGDPDLPVILSEVQRTGDDRGVRRLKQIIDSGWIYDLYSEVERVKIALSKADVEQLQFDRPDLRLKARVSRAEFENLIAEGMALVRDAIVDALNRARITRDDVDLVACTGGSSQIPAFQSLLAELFGAGKVQQREPYSTIAMGLGLYARRLWA